MAEQEGEEEIVDGEAAAEQEGKEIGEQEEKGKMGKEERAAKVKVGVSGILINTTPNGASLSTQHIAAFFVIPR